MDIVTIGPFRTGSLRWRSRTGDYVETLVCKATFTLQPVTCVLADVQEPVFEADDYWDDDITRSLHFASDLAPFKVRADVVLIGDAFAPRGEPTRSAIARLIVGEIDKSIEIFCDRTFTREAEIIEGARWRRFPLRYERSAGGPGTTNPVGVRRDGTDTMGRRTLPNLQPPGQFVQRPTDVTTPIGFGPIAADWPERRDRLGRLAATWPTRNWNEQPMPDGIEPRYFNVAPSDQQVDILRPNERLVLENLHPDHARLATSLPGIFPNVRVARGGVGGQTMEARADTLVIDTSRGICTLTWRMQIPLASPEEEVAVVVTLGQTDAPSGDASEQAITSVLGAVERQGTTIPFVPKGNAVEDVAAQTLTLPDLSRGGTLADFAAQQARAVLPFRSDTPPVPPPAPSKPHVAPTSARAAPVVPPDFVPPPPPPPVPASAASRSPWAAGPEARSSGPTIGESAAALAVASPSVETPKPTTDLEVRPSVTSRRAEGVSLVWHEPTCVKRLRRDKSFRRIMTEFDLTPPADPVEAALEEDDAADVQDKRRVHEVLARGEAQSSAGLRRVLEEARERGGRFEPALVLVAGDLEMPFDEVESLRATVTAVSPFVGGDKKLKDALETATELLKTPWLEGSGGLAASLLERLREAFAQARHGLPADHLETHTERMLLQKRRYQRRLLYGKPSIRGLLQMGFGAKDAEGDPKPQMFNLVDADRSPASLVPTYLPESIADGLPMFRRLAVRALVEVGEREDQYEVCPMALRVVALARVLSK